MGDHQSYRRVPLLLLLVLPVLVQSCHKHFLDAKPSTTLSVPSTLSDFQSLLDNISVFNLVPTLGEASCDEYFFPYNYWLMLDTRQKNAFVWAPDIFQGQGGQQDWNMPYEQVFYANVVLDGMGRKPEADSVSSWNMVEGEALFARAFAFYNLSQIFAPVYAAGADTTHFGIPLRLHSDISTPSVRSTIAQTYQQIINDLDSAELFLPAVYPNANRNRPIKMSAQALLARVYLSMRNYPLARAYADSALQFYNSLLDYNTLDTTAPAAFGLQTNPEVFYQASFLGSGQYNGNQYYCYIAGGFFSNTRIDSSLISWYDPNDLRRIIYYRYKPNDSSYLKGSYTSNNYCFGGLATDELYLIRAEGAARAGDYASAMNDVNTLLARRWRTGAFHGYTVASAQEALDTVLLERRKELAFRGLRWTDLRRLNAEGANIFLIRGTGGFPADTLAPNSEMYTLPIPPDVLNLSKIAQNPGHPQ